MRKTLLVVSMTVLILSTMFVNAYADTGNTDYFDREFERNAWLMNLTDVSATTTAALKASAVLMNR